MSSRGDMRLAKGSTGGMGQRRCTPLGWPIGMGHATGRHIRVATRVLTRSRMPLARRCESVRPIRLATHVRSCERTQLVKYVVSGHVKRMAMRMQTRWNKRQQATMDTRVTLWRTLRMATVQQRLMHRGTELRIRHPEARSMDTTSTQWMASRGPTRRTGPMATRSPNGGYTRVPTRKSQGGDMRRASPWDMRGDIRLGRVHRKRAVTPVSMSRAMGECRRHCNRHAERMVTRG